MGDISLNKQYSVGSHSSSFEVGLKGWDAAKVEQTMSDGPRNNEIVIEKKIPMHLVYFTTWVGDDGKVRTFGDIYGHEKRITQALRGELITHTTLFLCTVTTLAAFAAVFGTIAAVVAAEHYRDRPHYERSYNYGPVDRGPHPHGDWKHYRRW